MAKRKETLEIEKALIQMCHDKGLYGCEEITIGFVNGGHGNEIVDFMTMDSKGVIRCYEIKVTMQDLKSQAKKSWYGNYNYLIVTRELYDKIHSWVDDLPEGVGVLLAHESQYLSTWNFQCMIKPKKHEISNEVNIMLKESMVRSLYYKMVKYMDSQSIDKMKDLQKDARRWEKNYRDEQKEKLNLLRKISTLQRLKRVNEGEYISIDDLIETEKAKANIKEEEYI